MTGFVGTSGGNKEMTAVWVGTPSGNKEVMSAWVGTSGGNRLWWQKVAPISLTATATSFAQVTLSWSGGLAPFTLKRGSTTVYSGSGTSFNDTGLVGGTAYTYTITDSVGTTATASATTSAAPAVSLSASAASIQQINVSWTSLGAGWSYTLVGNGSTLVSGTAAASFGHTGLGPSQTWNYTVSAIYGGAVQRTASGSASTPALPAFGMSATATAWNNIYCSWTSLGAGWSYYLDSSAGGLYSGTGTAYNHGVGESSGFNYATYAYFNGTHYITAGASASTPARPKSYGTAYGRTDPSPYTGWTGSTRRYLTGNNVSIGVGGTMTNITMLIYGHTSNGRVEPVINGIPLQHTIVGTGRDWRNFPIDIGFAAGTFSTGANVGGTSPAPIGSWGNAEWSAANNVAWDYNVCTHHIDYWFYASLERDEEMRRQPWWDERLAGRESLYIETWNDGDGDFTAARITDSDTSEVLVEWEREG